MIIENSPDGDAFIAHWQSLRSSGALLPTSADFLDHPDPDFAPSLMMMEVTENDIVIRLQATSVTERWGGDYTGYSLFDCPWPTNREEVMMNAKEMITRPCGLRTWNRIGTSHDRSIGLETVGLPLAVTEGRAPRIVNFTSITGRFTYGESPESYEGYTEQKWLDLGAGTPSRTPATPKTVNL